MGRKNKRKRNNNPNNPHCHRGKRSSHNNKRQRRERYWVEDCRENNVEDADLTVLITRTELTDDHPTSKKKNTAAAVTATAAATATATAKEKEATTEEPILDQEDKKEVSTTKEKATRITKESMDHQEDEKNVEEETTNDKKSNNDSNTTAPENSFGRDDHQNATDREDSSTSTKQQHKQQSTAKNNPEARIRIQRDSSAKQKPKKFSRTNFQHLPHGDCGDGITNPYPTTEVADKYWAQRHRLFSRFDKGIELDQESWYSVTPEAIAKHIAQRMVQQSNTKRNLVFLDAFCGAGGNAIALAQKEEVALVVCVDIDKAKLQLAAKNASIYNIPTNKLLFLCADACNVVKHYKDGSLIARKLEVEQDSKTAMDDIHGYQLRGLDSLPTHLNAIFLSPPWGGVEYQIIGPRSFHLKCIKLQGDVDGEAFLEWSVGAIPKDDGTVVCFLPRNTNGLEIGKSALKAGITDVLEVEQNILNDKFKAVTIYMGGARVL